ncbi:TetR/AcrR family transcriptional regulator [Alistipes sp.]|uniref:TetR/AcrR family transcriptional regulator n=1 Tax=Alistipes sp. TaxID=1872444 RepID=UPI003AB47E77
MKRGATKEEIIRITRELIARNGIRAVRVDEIAQTLGISKRTLYEMFADKNDLVGACLDYMSHQQRERIVACSKRRGGNALQKVLKLANEYIDNLYMVDPRFLSDIRHKVVYAEHYDEHREFWLREITRCLEASRDEELLLPEIDAPAFADRLMNTLYELRLRGTVREELYLFCRTILRGAATRKGIELIDRR